MHVTSSDGETYRYQDLADRIQQVLGVRPSLSTLRAAVARPSVSSSTRRPRITAGLPMPLPSHGARPVLFDADQVERWLAEHPWIHRDEALTAAGELLNGGADPQTVVRGLRQAGISWSEITELIARRDGHTPKSSVHKKFSRGID